jgi:hypothetical protein
MAPGCRYAGQRRGFVTAEQVVEIAAVAIAAMMLAGITHMKITRLL